MRRRPSRLVTATAAVLIAVLVVAGCEAKVYGTPPAPPDAPQLTVVAPQGSLAPLPDAPPDEPAATFDGLDDRAQQATADAAKAGADITAVVLDRNTGQAVSNGNNQRHRRSPRWSSSSSPTTCCCRSPRARRSSPRPTASSFDAMLRSSDDSAAEVFWNRSGGSAIITGWPPATGCAARGPRATAAGTTPSARRPTWCATTTCCSPAAAGCRPKRPTSSSATCSRRPPLDGIARRATRSGSASPTACPAEQVAFKQGWMCCCIGADWMHLSTGVIGPDRRYVMAIGSTAAQRRRRRPAPPSPRPSRRCSPAGGSQSPPSRSGRRSLVRCSACSRRHAAIFAWSPDSSTSGTSRPRHLGGRV